VSQLRRVVPSCYLSLEGAACATVSRKKPVVTSAGSFRSTQHQTKLGVGRHFAKSAQNEMMDIWFVANRWDTTVVYPTRSGIRLAQPALNRREIS